MKIPTITKESVVGDSRYIAPKSFPIGPFEKYENNPILKPDPNVEFESKYLYNATAIVIDDKVYLLYRAQNKELVSSIGLAYSSDGVNFKKLTQPILYPTEPWESGGGCEDPRITRDPVSGLFVVTYTSYDLQKARLCVATSTDLLHWKKYPPFVDSSWSDVAIDSYGNELIRTDWSKSGAIFPELNRDNKYYMVWGDCALHLAESHDMVNWSVLSAKYEKNIFSGRKLEHESKLIEVGPTPIKLDNGTNQWILFYNAATVGGGKLDKDSYSVSQMLVDYDKIKDGPIARLDNPILVPDSSNELNGQVNKVVFCEGLVQFKGRWLLYYGQGDSNLGVAFADV